MKNFITLTAIISFLGLGSIQAQAQNNGPRLGTGGVVYSFSADKRLTYGHFVRVTLFSPNGSEFTIVETTITDRDAITNRPGEKMERTLATRIPCVVKVQGNKIKTILCKEDRRPVDGALKIIAVVPSRYGSGQLYDLKVYMNYFDPIKGQVEKFTDDLVTGLKRTN